MSTTIPGLLSARARTDPEHIALAVEHGLTMTYSEWEQRANDLTRALLTRNVRPGDRIALYFDNARWTEYAAWYIAVHKAGAAVVPVSPRFAPAELETLLRNAGAALIVTARELQPAVRDFTMLWTDDVDHGDDREIPDLSVPDDLAEVIYTSGTTSAAKGVACTHRNLLVHDLPPDSAPPAVFLHAFPVGTNAGQECLRMPLRRVATAVVLPAFDPDDLCAAVSHRGIRRLQLVPSMAQLIVESRAPERHDVSSVERVILSSAPAPAQLWGQLATAFPNASLWNAYALTEGGAARTLARYDPARPTSVGRPVGETEVRISSDSGDEVATGESGEVWLRRRGAPPREYYGDPVATAAAFAGDWLRTGDIGYVDEDGRLHLVDRLKDVIISGGLNVSSVAVEQALTAHPAVAEAAVFGVPHTVLGQDVAAAVVLRDAVEVRALQSFVRARLAEHSVPHRIFVVDTLPRTESGKVIKRELRQRFAAAAPEADPGAPAAPRDPVESLIAAIWCDVIGVERVGVDDDFFALGGQSLAATQVAVRMRDAFDVDVPATAVFEQPTVAELAAAVTALRAGVHA